MSTSQEEPPSSDSNVAFNTFIGVLISVCGNVLISVALNVQKLAHNRIQEKTVARYFANMDEPPRWISTTHTYYTGTAFFPDDGYSSTRTSEEYPRSAEEELEQRKLIMAMAQESRGGDSDYLKSQLWWLGISLMILGEVGNFVAYGFAPASTIAPLGTTTLVSNVILAPLILKEVFRKRDLLGVVLAVLGAAMVVLSSNGEETPLSPEVIIDALTQTRSIVYFIATGIAITILTLLSPVYGSRSIMIDLGLVAIYGGYTVLCTKSVASLLSLTFIAMFAYTVSYLLILVLFVTAVLQIKYLNKALQRFESTEVIPTQFVLFTISAIIGSAILYHDFDNMKIDQMSRFMTGCAVEFLGVYLITSKRNKQDQQYQPLSISADASSQIEQEGTSNGPNHDLESSVPAETAQHIAAATRPARHSLIQTTTQHEADRPALRASSPPEEWPGTLSFNNQRLGHRRRRSSVFRGISLTSQLVDRMNDEPPVNRQSIQLPLSSPTWHLKGHFRGDSALGSLFAGLTAPLPPQPQESISTTTDADAVEIEIPTATTLSSQRNSEDDRELLPMNTSNSKRNSARLVDIEESAEYRDLN